MTRSLLAHQVYVYVLRWSKTNFKNYTLLLPEHTTFEVSNVVSDNENSDLEAFCFDDQMDLKWINFQHLFASFFNLKAVAAIWFFLFYLQLQLT